MEQTGRNFRKLRFTMRCDILSILWEWAGITLEKYRWHIRVSLQWYWQLYVFFILVEMNYTVFLLVPFLEIKMLAPRRTLVKLWPITLRFILKERFQNHLGFVHNLIYPFQVNSPIIIGCWRWSLNSPVFWINLNHRQRFYEVSSSAFITFTAL